MSTAKCMSIKMVVAKCKLLITVSMLMLSPIMMLSMFVEAVLCCSLLSFVDVVVEVVIVDDLSLDDLDEDVVRKVLIEDASCTALEVDL